MSTIVANKYADGGGYEFLGVQSYVSVFSDTTGMTITKGHNAASVIDEGVGRFTYNFSVTMENAHYNAVGCSTYAAGTIGPPLYWAVAPAGSGPANKTSTGVQMYTGGSETLYDVPEFYVSIIGRL